jgi:hypothetical protein
MERIKEPKCSESDYIEATHVTILNCSFAQPCTSMYVSPTAGLCNNPLTECLFIDGALWRFCEVVFQDGRQGVDDWKPHSTRHVPHPRVCASASGIQNVAQVQPCAARCTAPLKVRNIKSWVCCLWICSSRSSSRLVRPGSLGTCETTVETDRFRTFDAASSILIPDTPTGGLR